MSSNNELQEVATALRKRSLYFNGWNINVLQAFIRDGGCCVYCGNELLNEFGVASCGDHLLPKSLYPDLAENVDNLVPACAECNHIKRVYDPSDGKGKELVITDDIRLELVRKAKEEINRLRRLNDWEKEFQTAKDHFREAVIQHRQRRKSAA
jgi:5-methylcytosine-specific restriction endonuclease McrA